MLERVAIAPEGPTPDAARAIVTRARQRGFRRFLLPRGEDLGIAPGELLLREGDAIRPATEERWSPIHRVGDVGGLERLLAGSPEGGTVIVEWTADRVIPLESAVAGRGRRFRLWTLAHRPAEVPAALGALEQGADLVIVPVREVGEVDELERTIGGAVPSGLSWTEVEIRDVRPAGIGDRVIVDTTSLLGPTEGLLVGSAAAFLFHVASEAIGSAFSRPRPFRVNAGSAHSYVLLDDGSTRYLSELEANDRVLALTPRGAARAVRVGRIKIERRPMVVVRAEDGGAVRTVFLQEAETVRLSGPTGAIPTTGLAPGTRVLGVRLPAARHLGQAIEETIEER